MKKKIYFIITLNILLLLKAMHQQVTKPYILNITT